jgi:hypothetical protein
MEVEIVVISPGWDEVKKAEGDNLKDAIAAFDSEVWRQGRADGGLSDYNDWSVYEREGKILHYRGYLSVMRTVWG